MDVEKFDSSKIYSVTRWALIRDNYELDQVVLGGTICQSFHKLGNGGEYLIWSQGVSQPFFIMAAHPDWERALSAGHEILTHVKLELRDGEWWVRAISDLCVRPHRDFVSQIFIGKAWNSFLHEIRHFFSKRGAVEVQTPTLVECPGTEPTLEVFSTDWKKGSQKKTLFLPTSPELHLKKLLCRGWTDIFEIKPCFRNEELSPQHSPEFTMLEWYRGFSDLDFLISELQMLLENLGATGLLLESAPKLTVTTMANLFKEYLGFDLHPQTTVAELLPLLPPEQQKSSAAWNFNDVFHLICVDLIEPGLEGRGPLIVRNFPPSQAALAEINSEGWADRFEFYWKGYEIANAFQELRDPIEQRLRFQKDLEEKKRLGREAIPLDEDFLQELSRGMPPTAGVALGLERLFMACQSIPSIEKTKLFAYKWDQK